MSLADELATLGGPIVAGTARILILDVERLPGRAEVPFWDLSDYKSRRIHADHVTQWPRIICAAWQWYDRKTVEFAAEWEPGGRHELLERTRDAYDQADIVVGHNLAAFDTKHLKGEWHLAGMRQPSPWKTVDTLKVARTQFAFESNTLNALCERFGVAGKHGRYDADTAQAALDGHRPAQVELKRYNVHDVKATKAFYDALRGVIPNHPHVGTWGDEKRCPQCGSDDLKLQPTKYRAVILDYALYRCQHCGGNVRGGWQARAASTRGV